MPDVTFSLEHAQIKELADTMNQYGDGSGYIIDDVLHNQGGKLITERITQLLPVSGRTWKGKKKAAKAAQPFTQENGALSVTVRTKTAYNYLYFPDDGSNSKRHIGQQHFMQRGAEDQADKIIDLCIAKLTEKIGR